MLETVLEAMLMMRKPQKQKRAAHSEQRGTSSNTLNIRRLFKTFRIGLLKIRARPKHVCGQRHHAPWVAIRLRCLAQRHSFVEHRRKHVSATSRPGSQCRSAPTWWSPTRRSGPLDLDSRLRAQALARCFVVATTPLQRDERPDLRDQAGDAAAASIDEWIDSIFGQGSALGLEDNAADGGQQSGGASRTP